MELGPLLEAVQLRCGQNCSHYSAESLQRRVHYAMAKLNCATVEELTEKILHNQEDCFDLLQFFTIQVSEMFRDPSYFRALREKVLPALAAQASLKIWVAGCSTGEEAYSLAILLHELGLLERSMIYATDINPTSLQKAESGVFDLDHLQKFTRNYQQSGGKSSFSDYYTAGFGSVKFSGFLKKNVHFANHNMATDKIFSEVHLISCRNVLIYFNRQLQETVFGLFHDSLHAGGFLGLGSKETVIFSGFAASFSQFAPQEKIFQKKEIR